MCYDPDARPPEPPTMRGKARGEDLTLTTEDGNRFAAYLASPDSEPSAQVLIYPVLGLFGGADQGIPASDVQLLKNELGEVGVEHEIVIYPGAPHSFFDLKQAEFADASADAWTRVLNFINTHNT